MHSHQAALRPPGRGTRRRPLAPSGTVTTSTPPSRGGRIAHASGTRDPARPVAYMHTLIDTAATAAMAAAGGSSEDSRWGPLAGGTESRRGEIMTAPQTITTMDTAATAVIG